MHVSANYANSDWKKDKMNKLIYAGPTGVKASLTTESLSNSSA
jgi:hypothetical protein